MPDEKKNDNTEETTKPVRRFRLVGSTHQSGRGEDRKTYNTGDVVESEDNLATLVPGKFVEVTDDTHTTTPVAYGVGERDSHQQDVMTPFHPYQPPANGMGASNTVSDNPTKMPGHSFGRADEREQWLEEKGLEQTPEDDMQDERNEKITAALDEKRDAQKEQQEKASKAPVVKRKLTTNPRQPQPERASKPDDLPPVDETDDDEEEENDYEAMTVSELRKYASDNRIDLKGATSKADIIKAIEAHK